MSSITVIAVAMPIYQLGSNHTIVTIRIKKCGYVAERLCQSPYCSDTTYSNLDWRANVTPKRCHVQVRKVNVECVLTKKAAACLSDHTKSILWYNILK